MPGRERGADRRREQQGHSPGLALVPSGNQGFRVRKHLSARRASGGGLGVSHSLPISFHLSAVEAHRRIVAERPRVSTCFALALARPATKLGNGQGEGRKVTNCVTARRNRAPFWIWNSKGFGFSKAATADDSASTNR